MKIETTVRNLLDELKLVEAITPTKPALVYQTHALVHAADGQMVFYATDANEVAFQTSCAATMDGDGSFTLPTRRVVDLLEQSLPESPVQIVTQEGGVLFNAGKFRSRLQTVPVEEFHDTAEEPVGIDRLLIPSTTLSSLIKQVRYAVPENSKYIVNGALMQVKETAIALVATDGKRLSMSSTKLEGALPIWITIPAKTLDAFQSVFSEGMIAFSETPNHLFFRAQNRLLISRRLEGQFPSFERIIPRNCDKKARVNRQELASVLRRISLLSEDDEAVNFQFDHALEGGRMIITAASREGGEALEDIAVGYEGDPIKFTISWKNVLAYLEAAQAPQVIISCTTKEAPALFEDGSDFINVILLMRS